MDMNEPRTTVVMLVYKGGEGGNASKVNVGEVGYHFPIVYNPGRAETSVDKALSKRILPCRTKNPGKKANGGMVQLKAAD